MTDPYNEPAFFFFVPVEVRFLVLVLEFLRTGAVRLRGMKGLTNASSNVKTFLKSLGESVSFLPRTLALTRLKTIWPMSSVVLMPHSLRTALLIGPYSLSANSRRPWRSSWPETCRWACWPPRLSDLSVWLRPSWTKWYASDEKRRSFSQICSTTSAKLILAMFQIRIYARARAP